MNDQELMHLRRETAGMIFQDPHAAINPVHRIGDFLTETYRSSSRAERRSAATRAAELLREVQIDDADRVMGLYPHQVSGGMLQRVMIASVLMRDPQLILADEPTTALDVTTQAEVVALLDQIRRERGTALVFISHDIELVASLCDRILVMYQGRIIEHLTRAELRSGANLEPYTQTLLDCRPDITRRRHRLPVTASSVIDERYAEFL
jgi:ABC-type dipeptide/oligopeptide/nickel transport system ATPase component